MYHYEVLSCSTVSSNKKDYINQVSVWSEICFLLNYFFFYFDSGIKLKLCFIVVSTRVTGHCFRKNNKNNLLLWELITNYYSRIKDSRGEVCLCDREVFGLRATACVQCLSDAKWCVLILHLLKPNRAGKFSQVLKNRFLTTYLPLPSLCAQIKIKFDAFSLHPFLHFEVIDK